MLKFIDDLTRTILAIFKLIGYLLAGVLIVRVPLILINRLLFHNKTLHDYRGRQKSQALMDL
ncbi:hypothetical protein [Lysinibacillus pakistanensis]|uniref:1-acyl-sn-glycerol-3-phosphate acyltransferase n=1 Tax=Lysinibacillus pakistanensis TaxID=759811 RepID=A0ABX6DEG3_9BACI|nr:hypothetical protein GDS87_13355 [Lysinibacillus pakistanensis]